MSIFRIEKLKSKVKRQNTESSGYSSEATPVPIPNTEVKLTRADGTATVGE